MIRLNLRRLGAIAALGLLAAGLAGCVVYDERPYRARVYEGPGYYVPGHFDRWGYWQPGRYR